MSAAGTLAGAMADAAGRGLDRLDAQLLLCHLLGRPRAWLIAHDGDPLAPALAERYAALCVRRAAGEPFAYLVGEREFHGLSLQVGPAVLVPRPDTETLVDWALEVLAGPLAQVATPKVLDMGTGSGAIAVAVKRACPRCEVVATDLSDSALAQARANAHRLALSVEFRPGDWWQAVQGRTFDLVLSNPPYIAAGDPHLAGLTHEPLEALTPGSDGLDALRQIVGDAASRLPAGAWLLLEHGWDQATSVQQLLRQGGFDEVHSRHDLGGHARCSGGRLAPERRGVGQEATPMHRISTTRTHRSE